MSFTENTFNGHHMLMLKIFNETIVTLVLFKVNKNVHRKHHKENPNTPTLPIIFTWQGTPTQTKSLRATRFLAPSIMPPKRRN